MKRFTIVSKKDEKSTNAKKKIQQALKDSQMVYDEENPELIISVGGDGTLLYAVHKYINQLDSAKFIAIHTGTLGFFTDYTEEEINQCIKDIIKGEIYEVFESHLLEVKVKGSKHETLYALNEIRIENVLATQTLDIYIDNEFFETVRGNGMCLSTQAGSTAYNRALNGAVVDSGLSVMQLCEIAGLHDSKHSSLRVPYIMKDDRKVTFTCDIFKNAYLCYDHLNKKIPMDVKTITCQICDKSVKFARFKKYSFLDRVRNLY